MAPVSVSLSPAELSYLHSSLIQNPPIRPDGRSPTQFRPLVAETDILPSANGSARVCFADGTEAVVGVKAEVEKSASFVANGSHDGDERQEGGRRLGTGGSGQEIEMGDAGADDETAREDQSSQGRGEDTWLEIAIEIPGYRDDDALPIFLSAMVTEALVADGTLREKLWINRRFHWRLYVDVLLLSAPLSYPLPLLSLTTHLALLQTKLPALISEKDEDPLFNDDWDAATSLYPPSETKPAVTLLVMSVGDNIIFDPSSEELAVADAVLAVSLGQTEKDAELRLLAIRAIDPPSRLTSAATPNSMNSVTGGTVPATRQEAIAMREGADISKVWRPPRGGMKRGLISSMIKAAVQKGGIGEEVLEALQAVET